MTNLKELCRQFVISHPTSSFAVALDGYLDDVNNRSMDAVKFHFQVLRLTPKSKKHEVNIKPHSMCVTLDFNYILKCIKESLKSPKHIPVTFNDLIDDEERIIDTLDDSAFHKVLTSDQVIEELFNRIAKRTYFLNKRLAKVKPKHLWYTPIDYMCLVNTILGEKSSFSDEQREYIFNRARLVRDDISTYYFGAELFNQLRLISGGAGENALFEFTLGAGSFTKQVAFSLVKELKKHNFKIKDEIDLNKKFFKKFKGGKNEMAN